MSRRFRLRRAAHGARLSPISSTRRGADIGHIRLAREADLIVIAPATADLLAKMAHGLPTISPAPFSLRPAGRSCRPGNEPADVEQRGDRRRNVAHAVRRDGVHPHRSECRRNGRSRRSRREAGWRSRMAEPTEIAERIGAMLVPRPTASLAASASSSPPARRTSRSIRCATSPTARPGKQGHAIAAAAAAAGAEVTLVSGPVNLPDPPGVHDAAMSRPRARCWRRSSGAAGRRCGHGRRRGRLARRGRSTARRSRSSGGTAHAVADGEPRHPRDGGAVGRRRPLVIGFAAETEDVDRQRAAPSSSARAATGSSPTTCRPAPA